jgi:hypothetical protein
MTLRSSSHQRGGILMGLLITFAVLVCIAIAGGLWLAHNVRVDSSVAGKGGDVSIETPAGRLEVRAHERAVDPKAMGIPVYPGARYRDKNSGSASFEWSSHNGASGKDFAVNATEMITSDPPARVAEFYRAEFPQWTEKTSGRNHYQFEFHEGGSVRTVGIEEHADGTHIGIAVVGEPPAN